MQDQDKKDTPQQPSQQDGKQDISASDADVVIDDLALDDDDFEFDDVDLVDDVIDDLDDDFSGDDDWDDFVDDETMEPPAPTKRTFLQKYFNLIVFGIVGTIGGLWFLNTMSQPPASQTENQAVAQHEQSQDSQSLANEDATSPVEAEEQPQGFLVNPQLLDDPVAFDESNANDDTIATMPRHANGNMVADGDEGLPMPTPIAPEEFVDIKDAVVNEVAAAPEELTDGVAVPEEAAAVKADMSAVNEKEPIDLLSEADIEPQQTALTFMSEDELPDIVEPAQDDAEILNPQASASAAPSGVQEIDNLNTRIDELEEQIFNNNDHLTKKIDQLSQILIGMEQKMEKTPDAQIGNAQKSTEVVLNSSKNLNNTVIQTQKTLKTPPLPRRKVAVRADTVSERTLAPQAPPRPSISSQWALRSAQPGRAIISSRGGNDFKTIETGQRVSGLGIVRSIGLENGRWVVRGTDSIISQ